MILMTYVGGFYSIKSFIEEATRIGISRRVSPSTAKTLAFNDRVILCSWRSGDPVAFAEFSIQQVYLKANVANFVGMELEAAGKARCIEGGIVPVNRECGNFKVGGGWEVDASLSEIAERACGLVDNIWFMVGGPLTVVYEEPISLPTEKQFFRGFKTLRDDHNETSQGVILAVGNYANRTRTERK